MHCGTPSPQMRFLARCFSYTPWSNRLSAHEPTVLSTNVAIVLIAVISSAHADEQNLTVQTDTAAIENPPLPRPKPLLDATDGTPAVLISAFRHQHGEDSVVISSALTHIAQDQADAMAMRDSLDHDALAPFSRRIGRSGLSRAAEN